MTIGRKRNVRESDMSAGSPGLRRGNALFNIQLKGSAEKRRIWKTQFVWCKMWDLTYGTHLRKRNTADIHKDILQGLK